MTSLNLVAYERMGLVNPVPVAAIGEALDRTDLEPGDRAAELGCGNAALAMLLAGRGLKVLAIDRGPAMVDLARGKVEAAGLEGRVDVRLGEAGEVAGREGPFRLVTAVGTTGLADFAQLESWIMPGGWLLWGDVYFRQTPVIATGSIGLDYDTDAGWRARAEAAGLEFRHARISEEADWEAYLGEMNDAVADWLRESPDDPARGRVEAHATGLNALYSPANRASLGFILYLFRKPD
jgi:predicted O-methyltransferase YrrM